METVSSWRATYVPGRWVVLAGPTSVVIMQPAPAHMSGLLSDLWQDVVNAAGVADLAGKFSAFRLDLMPHFAAFFWAEDGMHSLIRGALRALDAETGDVVAEGEGFHTWNEVGLQSVRQVRVEMDELGDEPVLALPLVVGVVLASSVTIDSTQKVPLVLPTMAVAEAEAAEAPVEEPVGDVEPPEAPVEEHAAMVVAMEPIVSDVEPAAEEPAGEAASDVPPDEGDVAAGFTAEPSLPIETHDSDHSEPVPASEDENSDDSEAASEPSWPAHPGQPRSDAWGVRDAESLAPVDLFVDEDEDGIPDAQQSDLDLDHEPAPAPAEPVALEVAAPEVPLAAAFPGFPDAGLAQNQGGFLASPVPRPVGAAPVPQSPPPGWNPSPQNPYGPPQVQAPTGSPFAAPILPGHAGAQPAQAPALPGQPFPGQENGDLVLAVVCSFGHPSPPGSPSCRVCGQPVGNGNPRLVHKPVLAQLITAAGARVEVTDTVLIGRAPSAQAGDGNPILLPVPSPNSDISRTHLKVAVKDWDIVATDLHSTNGTMLVRPGQAPVRMMPGTPVTVEPGTILDLGDGGVITVGMPS